MTRQKDPGESGSWEALRLAQVADDAAMQRRASLTVALHAASVEDAREMLAMLGLTINNDQEHQEGN